MPFFIDDRICEAAMFQENADAPANVDVRLGVRVETISPAQKVVNIAGGARLSYDRLLIATGSSALRLSLPGINGPDVYVLRSFADARAIKAHAERSTHAVVIGGGRVGMKTAMALRRRGLEVTVVEQSDRIVPLQFDCTAADLVAKHVEAFGIRLLLDETAQEVTRLSGRLRGVILADGGEIPADLLVIAVGVKPNANLARDAGLDVNRGIVVNKLLRTNSADIYAAGDVAETSDITSGERILPATWTSAVEMGRIAGHNMAGAQVEYPGTLAVLNSFLLAGVPTVAVGLTEPPDDQSYDVYADRRGETYRKLIMKDEHLVGALMVGDLEGAGLYTALIKGRIKLNQQGVNKILEPRPSRAVWLDRAVASRRSA
jgi:NAD(P)H-nitrite reductase large subunit